MNTFLFPGQGSQEVGMGEKLYKELPAARRILDRANEILGYDLRDLMFHGPIENLTETQYAQPAIYVCSAMHLEKAKEQGIGFAYVAGHSLGEYSALYAAGIVSFEDGLKLVDIRGKAMAAQNGKGAMAAVLGLNEEELRAYMVPGVVMANLNTKTQIVISGMEDGIHKIREKLGSKDIKVKKLAVSAAFHSPQMAEAAAVMKAEIERTPMRRPYVFFISNVTGRMAADLKEIRANLISQITGQVRWYDSINTLVREGVEQFYEVGNGQVLRKINRAIILKPKCVSI
jgi:[acyl-carrier-protein] S-malonyltransferase